MKQYIILEDKILTLMNNLFIEENSTDPLIDLFKTLWNDYQDKWHEDYWPIYNKLRSFIEDGKRHNTTNDNTFTIEEDFEKLANKKKNMDEEYLNSLLNNIDLEIDCIQEISINKEKKEEKKRGCMECLIF